MLRFGMDRQEITTVHAMSYHMVDHKLDPMKYIFEKPSLLGRVARWQLQLSKYDIQYVS